MFIVRIIQNTKVLYRQNSKLPSVKKVVGTHVVTAAFERLKYVVKFVPFIWVSYYFGQDNQNIRAFNYWSSVVSILLVSYSTAVTGKCGILSEWQVDMLCDIACIF